MKQEQIQKAPLSSVHSHSVSSDRFKRRLVDFFGINITRDHADFFFLSVVDSNTYDKIRTIKARVTRNNARNIEISY